MKESNSTNKLQMLVKLAFVLFWFARALATNETQSLAANHNWKTPHDWPFEKSIVKLTNQVVRKSKSNSLSVEGWEQAFQRCFANVLPEFRLRLQARNAKCPYKRRRAKLSIISRASHLQNKVVFWRDFLVSPSIVSLFKTRLVPALSALWRWSRYFRTSCMFTVNIINYPFDNLKSYFRSICKIAISCREIFFSVKSNSHFHKILNAYKKIRVLNYHEINSCIDIIIIVSITKIAVKIICLKSHWLGTFKNVLTDF